MPRFLFDENVPLALREALKRKGFQVRLAIEDLGPGVRNSDIVNLAKQADDIILTFDADFLRLQPKLRAVVKVIYIDLHPRDPREAERLLDKWIDRCLAMLEEGNVIRLAKSGPVLEED